MSIDKNPKPAIKDASYRQYLASHFALNRTGHIYRLYFGNERINMPDGAQVNVIQLEVFMEYDGLKAISELAIHMLNMLIVKCSTCQKEILTNVSSPPHSGNRFTENESGPCPNCGAMTKWSDKDAFYGDGIKYTP